MRGENQARTPSEFRCEHQNQDSRIGFPLLLPLERRKLEPKPASNHSNLPNRAAMTMMHSSHICDPCQIEAKRGIARPPLK